MSEIRYTDSMDGITPAGLAGFFVGWPKKPSSETLLKLLNGSARRILALNEEGRVVGFVSAVTDGVLAAYIPFLEILPAYQGKGIGRELVQRMLRKLKDFYMIDLLCDAELQSFYEKLGMQKATGMTVRNFDAVLKND